MTSKQETPADLRRRAGRFTVQDAADMIGVSYKTLYWRLISGLIKRPGTRLGKSQRRYYTPEDVERLRQFFQGATTA
jgi:DNA-binding transcriptional MerR regulator